MLGTFTRSRDISSCLAPPAAMMNRSTFHDQHDARVSPQLDATAASVSHVGRTQWHVLSAADVSVSAWDKHAGPNSIVLVTTGRASETATAVGTTLETAMLHRGPCEPAAGRARDRTDGAQVPSLYR